MPARETAKVGQHVSQSCQILRGVRWCASAEATSDKKKLLLSFFLWSPKGVFFSLLKKLLGLNVSYENNYSPINNNRHPTLL